MRIFLSRNGYIKLLNSCVALYGFEDRGVCISIVEDDEIPGDLFHVEVFSGRRRRPLVVPYIPTVTL